MIKIVRKNNLSLNELPLCSSRERSNKLNDKKMLYLVIMKTKTKIKNNLTNCPCALAENEAIN